MQLLVMVYQVLCSYYREVVKDTVKLIMHSIDMIG